MKCEEAQKETASDYVPVARLGPQKHIEEFLYICIQAFRPLLHGNTHGESSTKYKTTHSALSTPSTFGELKFTFCGNPSFEKISDCRNHAIQGHKLDIMPYLDFAFRLLSTKSERLTQKYDAITSPSVFRSISGTWFRFFRLCLKTRTKKSV